MSELRDMKAICEKVLELDRKNIPGPWTYCYDGSSDYSIGTEDDPQENRVCGVYTKNRDCPQLIAEYRTYAPLIAKRLLVCEEQLVLAKIALERIADYGGDGKYLAQDTLVRSKAAEGEKP